MVDTPSYRPTEFAKSEKTWHQGSDEESTVGKMPPSESEGESEGAARTVQADPAIEGPIVS